MTTCLGCGPNTYGNLTAPGGCKACPPGAVCPGLFASPVVRSGLDWLSDPAITTACPPLTGPFALPAAPPAAAQTPSQATFAFVSSFGAVNAVVLAGIVIGGAVLILYAASTRVPALARVLHPRLAAVDNYSRVGYVRDGEPVMRQRRAKGGAFSVLSLVAFFTIMLTLILQRAANNTLSVVASNFLRFADQAFSNGLPFTRSSTWGQGVQVRVMAGGAQCGSLAWEKKPPSLPPSVAPAGVSGAGDWAYSVTKACGGKDVSQHVFKCEDCRFVSSSSLTLSFDYTCQAFQVEGAWLFLWRARRCPPPPPPRLPSPPTPLAPFTKLSGRYGRRGAGVHGLT